MINDKKIGIFDSGIGGITVLKEILQYENIINTSKKSGKIVFIDSSNSEYKKDRFFKFIYK